MQIQIPNTVIGIALPRAALAANWSINQILVADVIGTSTENYTRLRIDGLTVTARTDVALEPGQRLTLQISGLEPTPILKVLATPADAQVSVVARGLARELPQQATPQQTLRLVDQLQRSSEGAGAVEPGADLPPTARLAALAETALRALPAATALLAAPTLRRLVEQAATPTEARLYEALAGAQPATLSGDLRVAFGQLRQRIAAFTAAGAPPPQAGPDSPPVEPVAKHSRQRTEMVAAIGPEPPATTPASGPGELIELIDHVIARLKANHLQNVAQTTAATPHFMVEIPLEHAGHHELLRFEYQRESGTDNEPSPRANVVINLMLDDGHEFSARVRVHGDLLAIRLGSNDVEFNRALAARRDELRQGLEAQGLQVSELVVAMIEVDKRPRPGARRLIDARV